MDAERYSDLQNKLFQSRRYWVVFAAGAGFVGVGIAMVTAGLFVAVGWMSVIAGLLALARLIVDRWAVSRHASTLADWQPAACTSYRSRC